jgi:hypothetical protein
MLEKLREEEKASTIDASHLRGAIEEAIEMREELTQRNAK